MSDLVRMQFDIKINLLMEDPNERRENIAHEIHQPTFTRLKPPLPRICCIPTCSQAAAWEGADREVEFAT